ncbi:MAG: DUF2809 domain-containing protein, partial [Micromonosporaceae bacterium]|nr:DUF2809 domain-containing protein [Micromonosporaceae bacterium]
MRRSLRYLILAIGCFAGCVIIVMFFSEWAIIRGFLGDVLVVALVYFLLKVGYEFRPQRLAPAVLAVAVLVEGAQYLQVARHVGLAGNEAVQLV